jgi:hypothetical protein
MSQSSTIQLNGALQVSFTGGASALLAPVGANLEELDLGSWEEEEYVPFMPHLQAPLPAAAAVAIAPQATAATAVIVTPPPSPAPVQVLELCERCWGAHLTDNNREGWVLDGAEWCCSANCANRVQCTECARILGRDTGAWAQSGVCSHDCHSAYCARMLAEYPETDEEVEVDIDNV